MIGVAETKDEFDQFLKDISVPRQSFDTGNEEIYIPDEPVTGEVLPPNYPSKDDRDTIAGMREFSKFSSRLVVESFDSVFSGVGCFVSKTEDVSVFGATEEQKDTAVDAWANYLKDKGGDLPPGVLLLMVMSSIYAPKVPLMFSMRKMQEQNARNARTIEQLTEIVGKLQEEKEQQDDKAGA